MEPKKFVVEVDVLVIRRMKIRFRVVGNECAVYAQHLQFWVIFKVMTRLTADVHWNIVDPTAPPIQCARIRKSRQVRRKEGVPHILCCADSELRDVAQIVCLQTLADAYRLNQKYVRV